MSLPMGFAVGVKDFRAKADLQHFLKRYPVDGLVLFNSPFDSPDNIWSDPQAALEGVYDFVKSTADQIQFLAVDQEGGRVRRLRAPFVALPTAERISQAFENPEQRGKIDELYRLAARQMALSGVHLNFAPVCDLRYPESNQVIGDRSFGSDPEVVKTLVQVFCKSFAEERVWTTLKHFPGHGPSSFDSHDRIAELFVTEAELEARDLAVFLESAAYAHGIMTAHIAFENDPDEIFSLSPKYLPGYRKKIRSEILWITDDLLQMKAVSERQPWRSAYDREYDLCLLCGSLDQAAAAIEDTERHVESLEESFAVEEVRRKRRASIQYPTISLPTWKTYQQEIRELEKQSQDLLENLE